MFRFLAISSPIFLVIGCVSSPSSSDFQKTDKNGKIEVSVPKSELERNGCPKKDSLNLHRNNDFLKVKEVRKNNDGVCEVIVDTKQ